MGILDSLFGRPDYRQSLLDSTVALVNETERVYRNHLEGVPPSNDGLLKVRLLSAAFGAMVYVAGECAKDEEDGKTFFYACIDIAMRPFSLPRITPECREQEHVQAAGQFMLQVFKLIQAEMTTGPSYIEETTEAFHELVAVYEHCLRESAGQHHYETRIKSNPEIYPDGIIWTHLRFLEDFIEQVSK